MERQRSETCDGIILWLFPTSFWMILMATHVVRVCLYVNLTRCPFTHVLVGPLGWAERGVSD